jgi:hypothetical protein
MKVFWVMALTLAACTRANPAVCCLDEADCNANGFDGLQSCATGLACVDHQCVLPSCAMTGCMAAMPVCNITTDVCEGCSESSQCSRFTDTDVCDTATGACVECVVGSDCSNLTPVCDANTCRACRLDAECGSGACDDDGSCVAESAVVYMDVAGVDTGSCSRQQPCRTLGYAATQASNVRQHIVLAPGGYVDEPYVTSQVTPASHLFIHGNGASYSHPTGNDGASLQVLLSVTVRDLEFFNVGGQGVKLGGNSSMVLAERLKVHGGTGGISTNGVATLHDIFIEDATNALTAVGPLTIDRLVIRRGVFGIATNAAISINISNALIAGTSDRAIDVPLASGTIASSTIADSGMDAGTGARAVNCGTALAVRSSIIWAPGITSRVPIEGCGITSSIAGPTSVAGAMNVNPQFVAAGSGDYHLAANSPARDAVDTGPSTDFEGDQRPQGARFDIGADEAVP